MSDRLHHRRWGLADGRQARHHRHPRDCDRQGRCDCAYVVVFRDRGRQHKQTYRTLAEAREGQARRRAEVGSGEYAVRRVTLHQYGSEWIGRYQGTGRRGFRDETRDEYRAHLEKYALRWFPPQTRLAEIDPRMVADFVGWLVRQPNRTGGTLADSSVRNAFKPLSACLATARREGLIRHNPAVDTTLPHRPTIDTDEERTQTAHTRPAGRLSGGRAPRPQADARLHRQDRPQGV